MALSYYLTVLITFLSVFCGVALSFIAREELKPGKQYFLLAKHMLFIAVAIALLYFKQVTTISIVSLGFLIIYFVSLKKKNHDILAFFMLGALLWVDYGNPFLIPALIFLYGMIQGSLATANSKTISEAIKIVVTRYIWFLISAVGLKVL